MESVEVSKLDRIEWMRNHMRERMHALTGKDQFGGIEIANLIRMVATRYESVREQSNQADNISGPRWGLLLRLLFEEEQGNSDITPTYLSHCQNVSKNTISALLRGLEEQELISRQLDPDDRRIFRIHLTANGRQLIRETAPRRIEHLNQLVAQLSAEEQAQLTSLLAKLYRSMIEAAQSKEVE